MREIPKHLSKYIVSQDYENYTYEDQAVWRFIMKQLFHFLKDNAHSCYEEGLKNTGIEINQIPKISEMDKMLSEYGWRAVPVSGFIPPAAFMSFQAHRILPIASEMRTIENILYTPAPDIVHEAAGHAPILIDPEFTAYLGSYGEVAKNAIISSEDLSLYEAIRDLSDLKENQDSSAEQIKNAELKLEKISKELSYVSEAQFLGRMNWWTAEYGLIGSLESPKLFGAGLLSSISEAKQSLTTPKHLPLTIDCLDQDYDITEIQPQLFVAKDFKTLNTVLEELSSSMAYKKGGIESLNKAIQAKTICTIKTSNNKTYSGILHSFKSSDSDNISSLTFKSACLIDSSEYLENSEVVIELNTPSKIVSVCGGPSARGFFKGKKDFAAKKVLKPKSTFPKLEELLKKIREHRDSSSDEKNDINKLKSDYFENCSDHWLAALELYEISKDAELKTHLLQIKETTDSKDTITCIDLGLDILNEQ